MNENEFLYWLNGFFELSDAKTLDERQTRIIKDHLKLVFKKVTPDYGDPTFDGDLNAIGPRKPYC